MLGSMRSMWRTRAAVAAAAATVLGGVQLARNSSGHHHHEEHLPQTPGIYYDSRVIKEDGDKLAKYKFAQLAYSALTIGVFGTLNWYVIKTGARYWPAKVSQTTKLITFGIVMSIISSFAFNATKGVVTEVILNDDKETVNVKSGFLFPQSTRLDIKTLKREYSGDDHEVLTFTGKTPEGRNEVFSMLTSTKHITGSEVQHKQLLDDILSGNNEAVRRYKRLSAYAVPKHHHGDHHHADKHGDHKSETHGDKKTDNKAHH